MGHVIKSIEKKHTVNSITSKNIEEYLFPSKIHGIEQASTGTHENTPRTNQNNTQKESMVTVMKNYTATRLKTHIRTVYKQKFEFHKSKFVALSV